MTITDEKIEVICEDCSQPFKSYRMQLIGVDKPISHRCPDCRAKNREESEKADRQRLIVEIAEKRNRWRVESGIPKRFQMERFATFETITENQKKILAVCEEYAENLPLSRGEPYKSLGLLSYQRWGVGKSHLVCAIAHNVIDCWVGGLNSPVLYTTEPQLFSRIRATFHKNYDEQRETEEQIYHRLIKVPLLIVDDIGKEEVADPRFVQRVWFSVINGRYDNMLPMVITANLTPDGVQRHLGGNRENEASFDRLFEMLGGIFWELLGESYRQVKK